MIKGIGASLGIGIGNAIIFKEEIIEIKDRIVEDRSKENDRFLEKLEETKNITIELANDLSKRLGNEEAAILEGHIMLMSDPALIDEISKLILNEGLVAERAVENICDLYAGMFAGMGDELMSQRATDMIDIKDRIIRSLLGIKSLDITNIKTGSIVVARDLTPSMTAGFKPENIAGIITELGGRTSHSAILARALEIPAVVAVGTDISAIKDGDKLFIDGESGEIYINPEKNIEDEFVIKKEIIDKEKRELEAYKGKESITSDGVKIELAANIGNADDARKAIEYDAEGIGLFRTEFLFMDRQDIPSEEEQFESYRQVVSLMQGKPVIIRTLDIGGDKEILYLNLEKDENPFLGYRAVRFCLDRKEDIYKPQLKALLRAATFGDLKIMVPLVTGVDELRKVKELIKEAGKELESENKEYKKDISIGVMIETAAASLMADVLAKEADFFSIGTNDLIQYTMSVDRGNEKVSYLYSQYNPAVLRSIKNIITEGKKAGIYVGMCGEAAADKYMFPLLLSWGLDEFSMSASNILRTRKLASTYTKEKADEIANKALEFATEEEVREYLQSVC